MQLNARTSALIDITLVIGVAIVIQAILTPLTSKFASLGTAMSVLALSTMLVYHHGWRWAQFGLELPTSWGAWLKTIGQALLALVCLVIIGALGSYALSLVIEHPPVVDDRFAGIQGNVPLYIMWLFIGWLVGGFTEELVFRGFLINRVESLLKNEALILKTSAVSFLAIIIPALLFGFAHYWNRGLYGALQIIPVGIGFGLFYLLYGRKLLPLMLAHATVDTLGVTSRFLDANW